VKIRLNKPVVGRVGGDEDRCRVHADAGDVLTVIFRNPTHFVCDSLRYPDQEIIVFNSQCEIIEKTKEIVVEDPDLFEKYYHVYEEYVNPNLDDPFHTAFEHTD
jgi:hypothetical protein